MKILADAHIPYLHGVAEIFGEVKYLPGNEFTKEAVKDKDVLIVRTITHFNEKILTGSNVKLICSATIGYDHIDTAYCDAHNIAWRTAPGCNAASVEQYITAVLLYMAEKKKFNLKEKSIGIVGVGNVGNKVAKACEKLGMRVLLNDPPKEEIRQTKCNKSIYSNIEEIQRTADIITFHTPLTKSGKYKTMHLADDDFFDKTTRRPIIINAARGSVIDNQALKRAIKNKKISGAVIDCWENEPNIDLELLEMTDIATPHIAGYSADGKWLATKMSIENLINFFGLPLNSIPFQEIPLPKEPVIDLTTITPQEQLSHAVWHTYNPMSETMELKSTPDKFYWFRSNYPLRREYRAYTVINPNLEVKRTLTDLGFKIQ